MDAWRTPLCLASENGDASVVRKMLDEHGCPTWEFHRALFGAICNKQYDVVRLLLSRPECDINHYFQFQWGRRPFWEFNMIDLILSRSLVAVEREFLFMILRVGAIYGATMTVKRILEYDPGVIKHADSYGQTALAVSNGHIDIVHFLLKPCFRCDINKADYEGETPLFAALRKNHVDIARLLLLQDECEVSKETNDHKSAITWAYQNNQIDTVPTHNWSS